MVMTAPTVETHILKIFYKDNTFKSYSLPLDVSCAEVCSRFANKFLRISERTAAHFSLHLFMQGRDVKQLKPSDQPLKIQKELGIMGYKFNTPENENYFLFCLNEEVKSKMNEYRHSIMLANSHSNASAQILPAPAPGGSKLIRAQSLASVAKPTKEKFSFSAIKRKVTSSAIKKPTQEQEKKTPKEEEETKKKETSLSSRKGRRSTAPSSMAILPTDYNPQDTNNTSNTSNTDNINNPPPSSPSVSLSPSASLSSSSSKLPDPPSPTLGRPPSMRAMTISSSSSSSSPSLVYPSLAPPSSPPPAPSRIFSPAVSSTATESQRERQRETKRESVSPKLLLAYSTSTSAGEELEGVIDELFGYVKDTPVEDDVGKMMDNLFSWYPASTTHTSDSQPPPGDDEFNEILSALDLLKNV